MWRGVPDAEQQQQTAVTQLPVSDRLFFETLKTASPNGEAGFTAFITPQECWPSAALAEILMQFHTRTGSGRGFGGRLKVAGHSRAPPERNPPPLNVTYKLLRHFAHGIRLTMRCPWDQAK